MDFNSFFMLFVCLLESIFHCLRSTACRCCDEVQCPPALHDTVLCELHTTWIHTLSVTYGIFNNNAINLDSHGLFEVRVDTGYIWIHHLWEASFDIIQGTHHGTVQHLPYPMLLGGAITILKNMKVSWEGFSHILWNMIQMFETTNQIIIYTYNMVI